ncbi:hypothetical protein [Desulfobacter postgatei]|uniref:Uncharacterized protein n=1 Tax=Desulfobacter postgatei 2ac9 TaxID=879212 RepID=I5B6Y4_9BACT|nr:hypothetical protein [Desulfobacter postgatei]EIM65247.1 hypothetical protein DespoDRAFT_03485 [Desulfobacter postgatei 2ac9]
MVQDYDDDDDVIELIDVVSEESSPEDQEIIELTQEASAPEALLSDDVVLPLKEGENIMPLLDRIDIEALLEKLIEKKFSATIEKILFEVMEKVIKREIEEIKAGLKKDLDDIG